MDPYEARLFAVFTNFADSSGTLDDISLTELCAALQMETARADELVAIANRPGKRIPFSCFRDSLLKVLGATGDGALAATTTVVGQSDEESSGRELSPKFVFGSKKYGRRSRPNEHAVNSHSLSETLSPTTHGDDSLNEYNCGKALTGDQDESMLATENVVIKYDKIEISKQEHNKIELDHNRVVDCDEAIELCRSMRMGNIDVDLVKELFQEGDLNLGGRMTVGEFFHYLNKKLITSITLENEDMSTASNHHTHGEVSWVDRDLVLEMWEGAGISHCRQLLHDLGFSADRVNLTKLTASLDEEIKSLLGHIDKNSGMNVPSLLLQASLSLHRYELRCIRESMEQVFAENSKLKTDLSEANHRVQILAQEVDDNHAKMESSLRNKVKLLEVKQAELLKVLGEENAREREATNVELGQLRDKLSSVEAEEAKSRGRCSTLEHLNEELERRMTQGDELTRELDMVRTQLTREVRTLRAERERDEPPREHHSEIEKLTTLVSDFRLENKSLRDRNDELCVEIEDLQEKLSRENRRLSLGRSKPQCSVDISSEQAMSLLEECDAWGGGSEGYWEMRRDGSNAIKRRGDSPSKGQYALFEDESPRIGKLRRRHTGKGTVEPVKIDSNTEWELDSCSDGSLPPALQSSGSDAIANVHDGNVTCGLDTKIIMDIKRAIMKYNYDETSNCESCNKLKDVLSIINTHIDSAEIHIMNKPLLTGNTATIETVATQTEFDEVVSETEKCEKEMLKQKEENEKLTNMCRQFETSLEQLKAEYDQSEEYWAKILDEEREIFSKEQRISDEKFQDLLSKISEYEEQFAPAHKRDLKLATIDEKYSLELQFTELEEEFELYQKQNAAEIEDKIKEIIHLREQVRHLQGNFSILTEDNNNANRNEISDSVCVNSNIDETDNLPQAATPIGYLWNQSTIQSPLFKQDGHKIDSARDYQNPAFAKQCGNELNLNNEKDLPGLHHIKKSSAPVKKGSAEVLNHHSMGTDGRSMGPWCESAWPEPTEPMRDGVMIQCSELEGHLRKNMQHSQSGSSAWSGECGSRHDAEAACLVLEQRCGQLHHSLRQHQLFLETVQRNARSENNILREKLYNAEAAISKLQQRLTSADLLVKELYVENCQLTAFKPTLL